MIAQQDRTSLGGIWWHLFAFLTPFLATFLVDIFIVDRGFEITPLDSVVGHFCLGLKELASAYNHRPAYLIQEVGALLVSLSDADGSGEAVDRFFVLAIIYHVLVVFACGWWSAILAQRGKVPAIATLALAMVAATMPTLVLYSTHFADYYSYGVLLVPLSFGLYVVFTKEENDTFSVLSTFFLFGLATSLNYTSIIFVMPVGIAVAANFALKPGAILSRRFAGHQSRGVEQKLEVACLSAVFMLVCAFSITAYGLLRELDPVYLWSSLRSFEGPVWKIWAAIGGAAAAAAWGTHRLARTSDPFRLLVTRVAGPSLVGFLVGANLYSHVWISAGLGAHRAFSGPAPSWEAVLRTFYFDGWNVLLGLSLATALAVCVVAMVRRRRLNDRNFVFLTLAGLGITINIALGSARSYQAFLDPKYDFFGLEGRFFLPSLLCVLIFLLWLSEISRRRLAAVLLVAMGGIGAVSYTVEYIHGETPFLDDRRALAREVNEAVAGYIRDDPDPVVFCVRQEFGRVCYQSYAYNRCYIGATGRSRDETAWWTHDGRVRFVENVGAAFKTIATGGYRKSWPDHALFVGEGSHIEEYAADVRVSRRKVIVSTNGFEVSLIPLGKDANRTPRESIR